MKTAYWLHIFILDDEISYDEDECNITFEMREKWYRIYSQITNLLFTKKLISAYTETEVDDAEFMFIEDYDSPFTATRFVEIVEEINKLFEVIYFHYETESEIAKYTEPYLSIGIKTRV